MKKHRILLLAAVMVLFGCQTTPLPFLGPKKVDLTSMQTYQLSDQAIRNQERLQLILTEFKDEHGSEEAPNLASTMLKGQVERVIRDSGAELVNMDRAMREQLQKEIQLYEINGGSDYVPPKAANLAVGGVVHTAYVHTEFKPAHEENDILDGFNKKYVPDQCVITAKVAGSLSLYKVNPVGRAGDITFEGEDEMKSPNRCVEPSEAQKRTMLNRAMSNGLEKVDGALKTLIASRGHVVSARIDAETGKIYFQLSIKPINGAKPGVAVQFFEIENFEGAEIEQVISEGTVICSSKSNVLAYASLTDSTKQESIKKGTLVKLVFNNMNWWGHVKSAEIFKIGPLDLFGGCKP
ncbi:MAG: hypothetical protein D6160_09415 [Ketobacter sp.]|nr:MAG: hypothetical protein D6160_09415 [Ketobacter sp.]